ncbi:hypothetical protein QG052_06455 [Kingella kingae]|uniref:hypothetical protein n=1 Tax=Kingella kingae TaxID=504 RepID=UPI00254CD49B|nr:hypothetical protein [Kingella kingae]MDK4576741.1 hypothetical protein [Kingella kingae]MDK4582792.1 hypothetical protein [Kingella kingae]MDK4592875.1 hypothetical protein [Kingella kingae]MDK4594975.1 hypothetical protein [Kingella kingae]MDK4644639.1 hypothetical protein [Kingella kingae]
MPACVLAFLPTPKSHYTLASLLAFAIGYWLSVRRKCPHKLAALNGLAAGQANSGFVGYPLLSVASNANTASVYFPMNVLTENIVIMPLLLILLSWEKSHNHLGSGLKKNRQNHFDQPHYYCLAVRPTLCLWLVHLTHFRARTFAMLSTATAPLALFVSMTVILAWWR